MQNYNLVQASNGGTISISSSTIGNTYAVGAGLNTGAGADTNLIGSTIIGGTLGGAGNFNINGTNVFDASAGMVIDSSTQVVVPSGGLLEVNGELTNNGQIHLNDASSSAYNYSILRINGDTEINGSGEIVAETTYQNIIDSVNATDTLTLGSSQTVKSSASADLDIRTRTVNNGQIVASGGSLDLTQEEKINNNLLKAENGGTLNISSDVVNNGIIRTELGATTNLNSNTLTGGTFDGSGEVFVNGIVTLDTQDNMTISNSTFNVNSSDQLNISGDLVNNGLISIYDSSSSAYNYAIINIDGDVSISGAGAVVAGGTYQNIIKSQAGGVLTVGGSQSVSTNSSVPGSVIDFRAGLANDGLIKADQGTITFSTEDKINRNQFTAQDGGFVVSNVNLTNTGTISLLGNSALTLNSGTLTDGLVNGAGTIEIGSTATLVTQNSMVLDCSAVNVASADMLRVQGNLVNNADINLIDVSSSTSNLSILRIDSDVELSGSGRVVSQGAYHNIVDSSDPAYTLTLQSSHAITTAPAVSGAHMDVKARLVNNSEVIADNGVMTLSTNEKINNNKLISRNGGRIDIQADIVNNGTLDLQSGSTASLFSKTITGGTISGGGQLNLATSATGVLDATGGMTLDGVQVNVYGNGNLKILGTLENNGIIELHDPSSSTSNYVALRIDGTATLNGTGSVNYVPGGYNQRLYQSQAGDTLINGPEHTFNAAGRYCSIGTQLDNRGLFTAADTVSLGITDADHVNSGLFNVLSGTTTCVGDSFTNQAGGYLMGQGILNVAQVDFASQGKLGADGTGIFTIIGDVVQSGVLMVNVDDTGAGLLNITGPIDLGGLLDVSLLNGFVPTEGSYYDVLVASTGINNLGISMTAEDDYAWDVYMADSNTLRIEYVIPEPASLVLLALGGLGLRRRRRA